eukprot:SAG31_NODE_943_length_10852_cov_22.874454_11_plen_84_part_00
MSARDACARAMRARARRRGAAWVDDAVSGIGPRVGRSNCPTNYPTTPELSDDPSSSDHASITNQLMTTATAATAAADRTSARC